VVTALLLSVGAAWASSLEDAVAAGQRGDYAQRGCQQLNASQATVSRLTLGVTR
jgi:hypothetical protein